MGIVRYSFGIQEVNGRCSRWLRRPRCSNQARGAIFKNLLFAMYLVAREESCDETTCADESYKVGESDGNIQRHSKFTRLSRHYPNLCATIPCPSFVCVIAVHGQLIEPEI